MTTPLLEKHHEFALARRWRDQRDETALHELVSAYLRLAISIAGRYRNYGLPVADLVQEGGVGLMQAAARFDPERGVRFSTYAGWWIRAAVQDYVLRNWSIVRTGTTAAQKTLFFNLRRLRNQIADTPDGPMSAETRRKVADALGVKLAEVGKMESRLTAADRSLNAPVSRQDNGGGQWQDYLRDDGPGPEQAVMAAHDAGARSKWLHDALDGLDRRERIIITERRLTEDTVTLAALGTRFGISKERVRQIEHQALGKLRQALLRRIEDPVEAGLVEPSH
jgi:RNA polymerase sigma-32 factor